MVRKSGVSSPSLSELMLSSPDLPSGMVYSIVLLDRPQASAGTLVDSTSVLSYREIQAQSSTMPREKQQGHNFQPLLKREFCVMPQTFQGTRCMNRHGLVAPHLCII